ncbi:MAG: 5'-deoxynucleotidase [Oscillospiraceae bacterium]|nr:5'-deoxynucleotidase [Oscillospiraceae bacterium]
MNDSHFYALISRMKYIERWSLMRNSVPENIQEHSHMVAVLAHALGVIRRDIFHQSCDPEHLAAVALFHDASEILTGDMPTPIKYQNDEIMQAYKKVEALASDHLLHMLPEAMRPAYAELLAEEHGNDDYRLVKAADKLSALIKCMEERKAGNREFRSAEQATLASLHAMQLPEVEYFMEQFLPAFELDLDELGVGKQEPPNL